MHVSCHLKAAGHWSLKVASSALSHALVPWEVHRQCRDAAPYVQAPRPHAHMMMSCRSECPFQSFRTGTACTSLSARSTIDLALRSRDLRSIPALFLGSTTDPALTRVFEVRRELPSTGAYSRSTLLGGDPTRRLVPGRNFDALLSRRPCVFGKRQIIRQAITGLRQEKLAERLDV